MTGAFSEEPVEPLAVVVDMDAEEADWIKAGTWDLLAVTNKDQLRGYLAAVGWAVDAFAASPTYLAGVKTERWLKAAVEQLVAEQYA